MTATLTHDLVIDAIRAREFPFAANCVYLNHASDSPLPARAAAVMRERIELLQDPLARVRPREEYLADAQERLGPWLGIAPAQIAFLTNVAEATAVVANGLPWRAGDEVIVLAGEFASFVYPWRNLERLGVRLTIVPRNGVAFDANRVEAAITERTRLLAISQVDYQSGFHNDLAALGQLCRAKGVRLVVDASQALGVLPLPMPALGVDAMVAVGYKWLMAPHGMAVLAVAPEAMEAIRPTAPGRTSVASGWETDSYPLDWRPDARRYQGGALNWIGVAALAESLGLLEEIGIEEVRRRALANADRLVGGLAALPVEITSDLRPAHRSQIVAFSFGTPERNDAFVAEALAQRIVVGRRYGVRVGAHVWNTPEEIDRFVALAGDFARRAVG